MCDFHAAVIRNLADLDHVGDEESNRAAVELARQCPQCFASGPDHLTVAGPRVVIVGGAS